MFRRHYATFRDLYNKIKYLLKCNVLKRNSYYITVFTQLLYLYTLCIYIYMYYIYYIIVLIFIFVFYYILVSFKFCCKTPWG
jgi:hypothetical protein